MIWKYMCGKDVINANFKIVQMNNTCTNIHLKLES